VCSNAFKKIEWVATLFLLYTMEEIYLKIQMTEEYLCDLRLALETAEKTYVAYGVVAGRPWRPSDVVALTSPFLDSALASAKAAAISGGASPRRARGFGRR